MSKTNDTSNLGHPTLDHYTIADIELAAVTGAMIPGLAGILPEMIANSISAGISGAVSGVGYPRGK